MHVLPIKFIFKLFKNLYLIKKNKSVAQVNVNEHVLPGLELCRWAPQDPVSVEGYSVYLCITQHVQRESPRQCAQWPVAGCMNACIPLSRTLPHPSAQEKA